MCQLILEFAIIVRIRVCSQLAIFDIPIYEGDRINCVDLLDALTKDVLKTQGNSELPLENEELTKMKEKAVQVCTVPTSSSL